eukprot:189483-Chlamydomonas_euryale.AAC.4
MHACCVPLAAAYAPCHRLLRSPPDWYLTCSCADEYSGDHDGGAFSSSGGAPPSALSASTPPSSSTSSSSSSSVGSHSGLSSSPSGGSRL